MPRAGRPSDPRLLVGLSAERGRTLIGSRQPDMTTPTVWTLRHLTRCRMHRTELPPSGGAFQLLPALRAPPRSICRRPHSDQIAATPQPETRGAPTTSNYCRGRGKWRAPAAAAMRWTPVVFFRVSEPGRTRTLDSHASRLRRKLNLNGESTYIVNVWGVGYRLVPAV